MNLIIRWVIVAIAVAAAAWLVPGINIQGANGWIVVGVMALVLGFVNAIIRPILTILSCGCVVLTLGLFMLVINAATFWLAAQISAGWFGQAYTVDGFWPAFFGSIVVSIVSFVLSMLLPED